MFQRKYGLELISESDLGRAKLVWTLLEMNQKLTSVQYDQHVSNGDVEKDRPNLTMTRPDLSFSVHTLSQFIHSLKQSHMDAALKVVR